MVRDVIVLSQVSEAVNPGIRSDNGAILQSLLLPELSTVCLIPEKTLRTLVGLNVILSTAWCSPIGMRYLDYLRNLEEKRREMLQQMFNDFHVFDVKVARGNDPTYESCSLRFMFRHMRNRVSNGKTHYKSNSCHRNRGVLSFSCPFSVLHMKVSAPTSINKFAIVSPF